MLVGIATNNMEDCPSPIRSVLLSWRHQIRTSEEWNNQAEWQILTALHSRKEVACLKPHSPHLLYAKATSLRAASLGSLADVPGKPVIMEGWHGLGWSIDRGLDITLRLTGAKGRGTPPLLWTRLHFLLLSSNLTSLHDYDQQATRRHGV